MWALVTVGNNRSTGPETGKIYANKADNNKKTSVRFFHVHNEIDLYEIV